MSTAKEKISKDDRNLADELMIIPSITKRTISFIFRSMVVVQYLSCETSGTVSYSQFSTDGGKTVLRKWCKKIVLMD